MAIKGNGSALRRGRWSQAGQIYLITAVTCHRERIFEDLTAARLLIRMLRNEAELGYCDTLAFVVMPDHLHWLLQLGQGASLSAVVGRVKSLSARGLHGEIWQAGFHDRAVRHEDDLQAIARYVIANPVRAGLVRRVGLYPHWDAMWV